MSQTLRTLDEGVYSVAEIRRILQPSMTARKVHYWLDTGLLGEPISRGRPGYPTLLSFQQLLRVRTIQLLRDELNVTLPNVRDAFDELLSKLFGEEAVPIRFTRGVRGRVVIKVGDERIEIPVGQGVLPNTLPELDRHVRETRRAWEARALEIPDRPTLISNARILSGAPVIKGTRLETAAIAALVDDEGPVSREELQEVQRFHPRLAPEAIADALEFEGRSLVA